MAFDEIKSSDGSSNLFLLDKESVGALVDTLVELIGDAPVVIVGTSVAVEPNEVEQNVDDPLASVRIRPAVTYLFQAGAKVGETSSGLVVVGREPEAMRYTGQGVPFGARHLIDGRIAFFVWREGNVLRQVTVRPVAS